MAQVLGLSTPLFPDQAPPLVVAMLLGCICPAAAAKPALDITAASIPVLLPLDYVWWRALGAI